MFSRPQKYNTISQVVSILFFLVFLLPSVSFSAGDLSRVIVGYWHNWHAYPEFIRLKDVPTDYNVICVAFAQTTSATDMTMTFTPDQTDSDFKSDIKLLQGQGRKILLSLGGQNCHIDVSTTTNKNNFISSLISIVKNYGFDGIDIDLEGGSICLDAGDDDFVNPTSKKIVNLIEAVRAIKDGIGDSFWITAAPEIPYMQGGSSAYAGIWGAYLPFIHGIRDILTFVHPQYYNTSGTWALDGAAYSCGDADFIVSMTEMLLNGFTVSRCKTSFFPPLREDQIAFGIPATEHAGGGFTTFSDVLKGLDCIVKGIPTGGRYILRKSEGYPGLRGIMTWSINWDGLTSFNFAKTFGEYFGNLTSDIDHVVSNSECDTKKTISIKGHCLYINTDTQLSSVSIFRSNGELIRTIDNPENSIDVNSLSAGNYIVRVESVGQHISEFMAPIGIK